MRSLSVQVNPTKLDTALDKIKSISPNLVVLFTSSGLLSDSAISDRISSSIPTDAHIIGCSTSGEMSEKCR